MLNHKTHTLYFSFTDRAVVRVSLLMHKPIVAENLLADAFNLPQTVWPFFTRAFAAVNSEMAINGFAYDVKDTNGIVACAKSREALAELLDDIEFEKLCKQQEREAIEKQSGLS